MRYTPAFFHLSLLSLLLLSSLLPMPEGQAKGGYTPMQGKVTRVLNGDTLQFQFRQHSFRLQLYGIDAPEDGQPLARESRQHLEQLALLKTVRVQVLKKDLYARYIARVSLDTGADLSAEMLRSGLAWWYRQYAPKDSVLQQLEQASRQAKRGIWQQTQPVPPWEFREHTQ